jgi:putative Holliday junction resolvase
MKYLGIDYGSKKIGIAVSDAQGMIAFPKMIIPNNQQVITFLLDYIKKENINAMVIGHSINHQGNDNHIQKAIETFMQSMKQQVDDSFTIILQDERGSSIAARSHLYSKGNIENERWTAKANAKKREAVDAQAAAVILQRFLDKEQRRK